ncbi:MAG: hypothetical protein JNG88_07745 [Phycisphaerales bacterium]|nr:hypothetical protein [Phycisphaerales bacterium]
MARQVVLLISSIAVVLALFFVYTRVVRDPIANEPANDERLIDPIPEARDMPQGETLTVANMQVPPGGEIIFRVYDPSTGRPTDQMRCSGWSPVPNAKSEIFVNDPELTLLLPSGMLAVISAKEAQLTVDRVQKKNMKPKLGWMRGNVKFIIDRSTTPDRSPIQDRPDDAITISMEALDFDLDLGEMKTDGALEVVSRDFEIRGRGLSLSWNQADNRVESLTLTEGDELVLWGGSGIFGSVMGSAARADTAPVGLRASRPANDGVATGRRSRKARTTSYECVLAEDVRAEQWSGDERVGSLSASQLRLTFDIGAEASGGFTPRSSGAAPETTASAPAPPRERLIVKWAGRLSLGPAAGAANGKQRRRIEAFGPEVLLTRADATVRCGRLEYYDDTSQIWLYPASDELVHMSMGEALRASASSVYIDRGRSIVKLVGDVRLESRREGQSEQPVRMSCSQWAELHIGAATNETPRDGEARDAFEFGRLRSAEFVGDVAIEMRGQSLRCGRLNSEFREGAAGESMGNLITRAIAREGANLTRPGERMRCQMLDIRFAPGRNEEAYPQVIAATGDVLIAQGDTEIRGRRVDARLAESAEAAAAAGRSQLVVQSVDIDGDAALRDPGNQVDASGRRIEARFDERGQLITANVTASEDGLGRIRSGGFSVRGAEIAVDRAAQTLRVPGRSVLRFISQTGLGGQRRSNAAPVIVTSDRMLHIDGRANRVYFTGDVEARSGEETLRADEMALHLEDAPESAAPATQRAQSPTLTSVLREAAPWLRPAEAGMSRDLVTSDADTVALRHKEPIRLVATNAVVESEARAIGEPLPLVHSSITAPSLDVDIPGRVIRTAGKTTLLITDRRMRGLEEEQTRAGLPSALVTRGPSQSAMQCEGGMTYRIGQDGAIRTDNVLFERAVIFVHRAGREMVALEEMLPQLQKDKELLAKLKSRNTYLECDRMEVAFQSRGESESPGRSGGALASGMRLNALITSGNTYLVDREGAGVRTVHADRMEFDRERGILRVFGTAIADARVYYENAELRRFDAPAVGPRFIIDLNRNTVEADQVSGEVRR